MSSILKALKKLEEEKALRRDEALDLPREILTARREKRSVSPIAWGGAIIAGLLLTIALTTLVVRRGDQQTVTTTAGSFATPEATAVTKAAQEIPARREAGSIVPATGKPVAPPDGKLRPPYPADNEPLPAAATTIRAEPRAVITAVPSLPATASVPPGALLRKPALTPVSEPPEPALVVSGIAWNKDSAERLAIINGQPTATGTYVNGFIVEEILPDRVRFSTEGKIVEILIGKSGTIH